MSAVHRAKRQIEKAQVGQPTAPAKEPADQDAPPSVPPPSYVTRQLIGGVSHDVRRIAIMVYESRVRKAVDRELLAMDECGDASAVMSALFAACFSDRTIGWLVGHGYVAQADRGKAEAIIAGVNEVIERLPW